MTRPKKPETEPQAAPPSPPQIRRPLWIRLALLSTFVGVVPLAVAGAILVEVGTQSSHRSAWALQVALADDLARTLESELHALDRTLRVVRDTLVDADLGERERIARATEAVTVGAAAEVAIYDADGHRVDSLARVERTLPAELSFDQANALAPFAHVALPAGHVVAPLPLDALRRRCEDLARDHLQGGAVAILLPTGGVLVGSDAEAGTALSQTERRAIRDLRAPVSSENDRVVRTLVPLSTRSWVVLVETPTDVVLAPLRETRTVIATGLAIAASLAVFLAIVFARRTVKPITALSRFAEDLAARRFDARVPIDRDDELGALARVLDGTARALESSEERIRAEEAIRLDLGRYLPAELVEKVVLREQAMELGGQRMELSVLFADVVAFTPLAEELPPERVVALLNELFTLLTRVVFRHGGTVDKFLGDSVMALFGAPEPHADHARRALSAAEDMLAFVETASAGWEETYGVTVQLAIGVATGEAVVGNVGSTTRMDYTAIGDVVNVAARLEAIARPGQILTIEATRDAAEGENDAGRADFVFADVEDRVLAGRASPLRILEVRP